MTESMPRTRRAFLTTLIGGSAAAVATVIGRPFDARAADGDAIVAGQQTTVSSATTLRNTTTDAVGLIVHNDGAGVAIAGQSNGFGAHGVMGTAFSEVGAGVAGFNGGVGAGVFGLSSDGYGVNGRAVAGIGVLAEAGIGGTALKVRGRSVFSRSGTATVLKGRSTVVQSLSDVSSASLVFAVVRSGDSGAWVRKVSPGTNKFTILMNKSVSSATSVAWFVVN